MPDFAATASQAIRDGAALGGALRQASVSANTNFQIQNAIGQQQVEEIMSLGKQFRQARQQKVQNEAKERDDERLGQRLQLDREIETRRAGESLRDEARQDIRIDQAQQRIDNPQQRFEIGRNDDLIESQRERDAQEAYVDELFGRTAPAPTNDDPFAESNQFQDTPILPQDQIDTPPAGSPQIATPVPEGTDFGTDFGNDGGTGEPSAGLLGSDIDGPLPPIAQPRSGQQSGGLFSADTEKFARDPFTVGPGMSAEQLRVVVSELDIGNLDDIPKAQQSLNFAKEQLAVKEAEERAARSSSSGDSGLSVSQQKAQDQATQRQALGEDVVRIAREVVADSPDDFNSENLEAELLAARSYSPLAGLKPNPAKQRMKELAERLLDVAKKENITFETAVRRFTSGSSNTPATTGTAVPTSPVPSSSSGSGLFQQNTTRETKTVSNADLKRLKAAKFRSLNP